MPALVVIAAKAEVIATMTKSVAPNPSQLHTVSTTAKRLGLSTHGVRRAVREGRIASYKVLSRVMISEEEINRILRDGARPRIAV